MRILADMGVNMGVVHWLRLQGHDATHLREEGLQRLPNGQIFKKAVSESRVILGERKGTQTFSVATGWLGSGLGSDSAEKPPIPSFVCLV